ncbi:MAG: pilus assembly PilX N-terminal domain-containing protein [Deltaproteobacteria bacterium]|nr:pilus assembly PilX N-terminal domain-containing protein [Deltaproteobacteria bacterium]
MRRASERGAAVFVVVLVITLLSALGLFAVRSASEAMQASGYGRQMTQTHYVTDYGMVAAAGELGGARREAYARMMVANTGKPAECQSLSTVTNATCFRATYADLQTQIQKSNPGATLLVPTTALAPGSLGPGWLEGDLLVELTDLGDASPPVPGMDLSSSEAVTVKYYNITVTATGQVRPRRLVPGQCDAASAGAAGIESARAHPVVGPLPAKL